MQEGCSHFSNFAFPYNFFSDMEKYLQLKQVVMSLEGDMDKFFGKGNKAAGTRVRKGMQDLKSMAQEIRLDVQKTKG